MPRLPAELRPHVRWMVGFDEADMVASVHRGLPGPDLTMVFPIGAPLRTAATWEDWLAGRLHTQRVVLGGLHTTPAFVENPGRWCGIQLAVHPLGARRLFGVPAADLPVGDWDARDLLGSEVDDVHERLHASGSWEGRYAVVIDFLLRRLARQRDVAPRAEVAHAWRMLAAERGNAAVQAVCDDVGYSRRRLTTLFAAEVGVAPKTAGRLMRFDAVRRRVAERAIHGRPLALGRLAAEAGYADQAHLAREFREFAGLSPTRWLAAETVVPFVQDAGPTGAARSAP